MEQQNLSHSDGSTTLENCLASYANIKHTLWPSNFIPNYINRTEMRVHKHQIESQ